MLVATGPKVRRTLFYVWRSLTYFAVLSLLVYLLHYDFDLRGLSLPFEAVSTLSSPSRSTSASRTTRRTTAGGRVERSGVCS